MLPYSVLLDLVFKRLFLVCRGVRECLRLGASKARTYRGNRRRNSEAREGDEYETAESGVDEQSRSDAAKTF